VESKPKQKNKKLNKEHKKYKIITVIISVIIPLAVALLFGMKKVEGYDFRFLPSIYATINGITAVVLVLAYLAIKKKNKARHKQLINLAVMLSMSFLVLYVIYHSTTESVKFQGEGFIRYVYFFILISHILLSIIITPFVCFTYLRGWLGEYEKHKKLTRITFPLWMYVAISGVLVYLLISPYYI